MQVLSRCPLAVASVLWLPRSGSYTFTIVCKATFRIEPEMSPFADGQEPVNETDSFHEQDEGQSLSEATDLVPFKRSPEVLIVGHAHAPREQGVGMLIARITISEVDKAIEITGDRHFKLDGSLSYPARFAKMPLRWERAAGGADTSNPVGVPMGEEARADGWGRIAVPNLVPLGRVVTSRDDVVAPACFGPVAPTWPARVARLHRHAAQWSPHAWHARPLPSDIDPAYFNAAPSDQILRELLGIEHFTLENLHARYSLVTTRFARVTPRATVDWGGGPSQEVPLSCDTLVIDTDRGLAMLTYRGHVTLDRPERNGWVIVTAHGDGLAVPEVRDASVRDASVRDASVRDASVRDVSVSDGASPNAFAMLGGQAASAKAPPPPSIVGSVTPPRPPALGSVAPAPLPPTFGSAPPAPPAPLPPTFGSAPPAPPAPLPPTFGNAPPAAPAPLPPTFGSVAPTPPPAPPPSTFGKFAPPSPPPPPPPTFGKAAPSPPPPPPPTFGSGGPPTFGGPPTSFNRPSASGTPGSGFRALGKTLPLVDTAIPEKQAKPMSEALPFSKPHAPAAALVSKLGAKADVPPWMTAVTDVHETVLHGGEGAPAALPFAPEPEELDADDVAEDFDGELSADFDEEETFANTKGDPPLALPMLPLDVPRGPRLGAFRLARTSERPATDEALAGAADAAPAQAEALLEDAPTVDPEDALLHDITEDPSTARSLRGLEGGVGRGSDDVGAGAARDFLRSTGSGVALGMPVAAANLSAAPPPPVRGSFRPETWVGTSQNTPSVMPFAPSAPLPASPIGVISVAHASALPFVPAARVSEPGIALAEPPAMTSSTAPTMTPTIALPPLVSEAGMTIGERVAQARGFPSSTPFAPNPVASNATEDAPLAPVIAVPADVAPPPFGLLVNAETQTTETEAPAEPQRAPENAADEPSKAAQPGAEPALKLDEYPLERCARIAASVARTRNDTGRILETHKLTEEEWEPLKAHWGAEIKKETERGKAALLRLYDAAYVAQLEDERGPIALEEYARIVVAAERGVANATLAELGLPEGSMLRIQRVWMGRTGKDPELRRMVRAAVERISDS